MMKIQNCGPSIFPSMQVPNVGRFERPGLALTICIVTLFCVVGAIVAPAQSVDFTILVSFDGTNGGNPTGGLVQATDGNLYGTTSGGNPADYGTVFKITPSGALTTLYIFTHGADGGDPEAGLVQGTDGNFYGTTYGGGVGGNCYGGIGCGTVFKITPAGTLTTLYNFTGGSDGGNLRAGLIQGGDGNFYGTTPGDGGGGGDGTVFKITASGTLTTLHTFDGSDGANPWDTLAQGRDGNFYGTTLNYGSGGRGTVFEITPGGTLTTLDSFDGADGGNPWAAPVQGSDGNFYGTTGGGGAYGHGTVFKITSSGALTTLYNFGGADVLGSDGYGPTALLVQARDGDFYGTTQNGGGSSNCVAGCGTVFKITPSGTLTTLHRFDGTDGGNPFAGLVQARDGSFYGTTINGGANNYGTIFHLRVVCPSPSCRP